VFRGHLRGIAYVAGRKRYLWAKQVLLKNFGEPADKVAGRLKEAALAAAKAQPRPVQYLASSQSSKAEGARAIAAQDPITSGPVCVLTSVEPCWSFDLHKHREKKKREWGQRERHGLFRYRYCLHPVFGLRNARIQTRFPFPIQIGRNGRKGRARQRDGAGWGYRRQDHCFPWVEDWGPAQPRMASRLRVDWPRLLDGIAGQLPPIHDELFAP
jgi:hypothetical protein